MTVYQIIKRNRRLIWIAAVLGCLLAIVLLVIRLVNVEPRAGEVLGSVALAVAAATAPTLALISLDRRPALLPAAALASVFMGIIELTLLPVWILLALTWAWAHSRRPMKTEVSRPMWWARVALGLGVAVSVLVLFSHLDPYCTQTMGDGTIQVLDPADQGMRTGWRFGTTNSQGFAGEQTGFDGAVSTVCSSDRIVWGEAVASLLISLVVIGAGLRWPLNNAPARVVSRTSVPPNVTS